jgi:hypothetical protein
VSQQTKALDTLLAVSNATRATNDTTNWNCTVQVEYTPLDSSGVSWVDLTGNHPGPRLLYEECLHPEGGGGDRPQ